ncbi:hypothetical protein EYR36_008460 [Pleurotus pulmonarius]|nr:hypothetical protein EYR36_008460 [Pleurotus pulmonarius]
MSSTMTTDAAIQVVVTPSQSCYFAGESFAVQITFTNTRTPDAPPPRTALSHTHKRAAHSISSAPLARPPTSPRTPRTMISSIPSQLGMGDGPVVRRNLIGKSMSGEKDSVSKAQSRSLSVAIAPYELEEQLKRTAYIRRVSKTSAVVDLLGGRYTRFAERSNERERLDYVYDRPFAPEITRRDVAFLQLYVSRALLPIVNHTLAILDAFPSRACPISRSASYRDDCDKCNWTLLLAYWMCIGCGRFTCTTCETASQRCRCDSEQILMSIVDPAEIRFLSTELQDLVSRVPPSSHHALSNSLSEPTIAEALDESIRSVPILSQRCSLGDFDLLWDQGIPFVVRDQAPGLRCDWSPAGLADVLGSDWCKVADCEDENYLKTALVDEFLLGLDEWNDRVLKLKVGILICNSSLVLTAFRFVKDYPTDQRLKSKSFILARDFQLALPVPAYSSEDGPLNIVNFFPINYSNAPDLGNAPLILKSIPVP